MSYDFDYFISYAHKDNVSVDGKSGFVDEFVNRLKNSEDHKKMFGGEVSIFFDKDEIHSMSEWDLRIRSKLAVSRFFIVLLSPNYFKSEYCAKEFDWWMQHEMHSRLLGEATAPMKIVTVEEIDVDNPASSAISDDLKLKFPNWMKLLRQIQSGPDFDMRPLYRAKIDETLRALRRETKNKVYKQNIAEDSPTNTGRYPAYNRNFVGRRDNLSSLRKSLSTKSSAAISAVNGLGGIGKTELAITYGHAFAWDYGLGRIFAKCENQTSIDNVLLSCGLAEMYGLELKGTDEQQISQLYAALRTKCKSIERRNDENDIDKTLGTHLLLILDNVNRLELVSPEHLRKLPPYFHVIITTRESANRLNYIDTESLEKLSVDESVELLSNLYSFKDSSEDQAAREIAKLLDGFTLAVEITGAYLRQRPRVTYQKQYERLRENLSKAMQMMINQNPSLQQHQTVCISVVLESTLSSLGADSRKALKCAAQMSPDAVAMGWFSELIGLDEDDGLDVLDELTGYNLLTPLEGEPNIARIHRLVAETVKQETTEEERKEIVSKIRAKCNDLLEKDETFWCSSENFWNITPVSEFLKLLAEQWTVEASEEEIDWGITEMLEKSGKTLKSLGKIDDALSVFKKFMSISSKRASVFSSDSVLRCYGHAYSALGEIDYMKGNVETAIELHTQAFNIRRSIAEKHPTHIEILCDLFDSYMSLGEIEKDKGNLKEAKKRYLEILKASQNIPALQDNKIQKYLGSAYGRIGDLENEMKNVTEARDWFEKAMIICKRLADTMPENIESQRNLSTSYRRLGDWENAVGNVTAARKWYEMAMEIRQRLADLMPENVGIQRNVSISYQRLGDLDKASGNFADARNWYEKAMKILKRLADSMPDNVEAQRNLSTSYRRLGDLEFARGNLTAAREWYVNSMEIRQRLAEIMPDNVEAKQNLNTLYRRFADLEIVAGNMSAAQEWYKKILKISVE